MNFIRKKASDPSQELRQELLPQTGSASLIDIIQTQASGPTDRDDSAPIYKGEEGTPLQWLSVVGFSLAAVLVSFLFHSFFFRGYDMEALDIAQLARNLSQGQGYSTDFIRPLLLMDWPAGKRVPDLTNAPLYPLLLGWTFAFLGETDRAIAVLPVLLLALSASLLFVLARRLTHNTLTSCLAVSAYLLSQPVLATVDAARPTVLSTCLLLLLLLAITPFSWQTDEEALEASPTEVAPSKGVFRHNFWVGALIGLCYLSDYFSLLYVLPLLFLWKRRAHIRVQEVQHGKARAWRVALALTLGVAAVVSPWLWRNFALTGNPFYSTQWLEIAMNTRSLPGLSLLREAGPNPVFWPETRALLGKFVRGMAGFFFATPFLPHVYLAPFVVCAFWLRFDANRLNRFKLALVPAFVIYILGLCLLGRSPAALLPLVPLMALLGAAAYVHLVTLWLNRLNVAAERGQERGRGQMRRLAPLLSVAVPLTLFALPLAWKMAGSRGLASSPVDYTVWFQPLAKAVADSDKRALASDMPWAVAWYTDRRAVWLPNQLAQLASIERKQPLAGIYLSPRIADPRSGFTQGQEWLGAYQGSRELKGFSRTPRPAQRDVFLAKRPSLEEVLQIARSQPKNPLFQLQLGVAQLEAGRFSAALANFERLRRLQPKAPHPYWGQGKAYSGLKAPDKALAAFTQAAERAGEFPLIKIESQLQAADILVSRGDQKRAAPLYEAVLADQPNHPKALNNLAFIYADDKKDLNRALEMARRAAASNPNNGLIRDTLGWVCFRMNRRAEAVQHLQEAARLSPQNSGVHLHLGQALMAMGQKSAALKHLQRARALSKTPQSAPQAASTRRS